MNPSSPVNAPAGDDPDAAAPGLQKGKLSD